MLLRCLILALTLSTAVQAAEQNYRLVGEAELKFMFWSVYYSRLYTVDGDYRDGQLPLRMEIEYQLPVKRKALVERTAREWDHLGVEHPRQEQWLTALLGLWPDLEREDVLALEVDADGVSTFFHNGEPLGRILDQAFGEQFLGIWLSPATSRPDVRASLIGNS